MRTIIIYMVMALSIIFLLAGALIWYTGGTIFFIGKMVSYESIISNSICLSPKRDKLTFAVMGGKVLGFRGIDIFITELGTGITQQITNDGMSQGPYWSNESAIIFESVNKGLSELYFIDVPHLKRSLLQVGGAGNNNLATAYYRPRVALSGDTLLFERYEIDKARNVFTITLCRYDLKTKQIDTLETLVDQANVNARDTFTDIGGHSGYLWQISPNGDMVVVLKDSVLYEVNLINKNKSVIIKDKEIENFDYTPTNIALLVRSGNHKQLLWIQTLHDTYNTMVTRGEGRYADPKWSPSGKFLAYADLDSKIIWIFNVKTAKSQKLVEGYSPIWINNEQLLVRRGKAELFSVSIDGKAVRRLFPPT